MAVSADSRPHFTTIANFVSGYPEELATLFRQVVLVCDELGLIGGEMFAIDGCKLPSNASKEWSGTRADMSRKVAKLDRAVRRIVERHRKSDGKERDEEISERERKQVKKLRRASRKLKKFLATHDEKIGASGKPIQSNVTDNDSAKMKTSRGVIQGFIGVVGVDAKHQVVVHAEAHGQPQEHQLLKPAVEGIQQTLEGESKTGRLRRAKVIADSGYHSRSKVEYLEEQNLDGYIADTGFRGRDPRFATARRHRPVRAPKKRFTVEDFEYDLKKRSRCPAGNLMWLQCARVKIQGYWFMQFKGYKADCESCTLRSQCLRSEDQKTPRMVNIQLGHTKEKTHGALERMRRKIDGFRGRHVANNSFRLGVVEPVFGHITSVLGFKRFTLRGRNKVDGQWKLVTMLHNLLKIHRYAWST